MTFILHSCHQLCTGTLNILHVSLNHSGDAYFMVDGQSNSDGVQAGFFLNMILKPV